MDDMATTAVKDTLDEQIAVIAKNYRVSEAQLKTVYLRGVNDFVQSDAEGSATIYGLARVLRFVRERGAVIDSDLVEVDAQNLSTDHGVELSAGSFFSPDIMYADGKKVAALFEPGVVTCITVTTDTLLVAGELGPLQWEYALDTATGADSFAVH